MIFLFFFFFKAKSLWIPSSHKGETRFKTGGPQRCSVERSDRNSLEGKESFF